MLRLFGQLCLIAATAIGGYIGWLLWGTGLYTERVQTELRQTFEPQIGTRTPPAPGEKPLVKLRGDAVAEIVIPRIDLTFVVVQGTDTRSLQEGAGHYPETAMPWDDHGRVGIAGHRTTYQHPFYHLDEMRPGDPIELLTEYGTYRYEVTRVFTILPSEEWVLDQTVKPTLVLTTCDPPYSASRRLIVFADRVAGPS